ncbi:MAG: ATP-binding cassette domain-containing protein, partial [Anaerolineales bacterium]
MMETIKLKSLRKKFPGVEALKGFNYAFKPGLIYGLVGENGAGKSTLVKILMGLHYPDEGEIILEDKKILIAHPTQARDEFGIEAVYQDQALIP